MLAVKLEKLHFEYGRTPVFTDLSLDIPQGAFCALVGRNGSGKSTLMKMMARLAHPQRGALRVLGIETDRDAATLLGSIGYVSESLTFTFPHLFEEILPIFRCTFGDWDLALERKLLAVFELDKKRSFLELSRGQRMLFCFMLAACHRPRLYLIDEITSVLDPYNRKVVLDHIASDVKKGATAILATNIVGEIEGYADRIIYLEGKASAVSGSLSDFCENFIKFFTERELNADLRKKLDASLVGSEGDNLTYISKCTNRGAIIAAGFTTANQGVLPLEAFIYLSQEEERNK